MNNKDKIYLWGVMIGFAISIIGIALKGVGVPIKVTPDVTQEYIDKINLQKKRIGNILMITGLIIMSLFVLIGLALKKN